MTPEVLRERLDFTALLAESQPGAAAVAAPPVRIYVGTEAAHHRAERVFLWSVRCHRDPGRRYEIHWLRDLPGFSPRGSEPARARYRYAVPELAGGQGRAIYNEVDQLYLDDPALLFDSRLDRHPILSSGAQDDSVLLMDCAVMADVWTLEGARSGSAGALWARVGRVGGPGTLAADWTANGSSQSAKLVRFSAPHTQPWRPFPERFVYRQDPNEAQWREREASADAAGFEVFHRDSPSTAFRAWIAKASARRASASPHLGQLLHTTDDAARYGLLGPQLAVHDVAIRSALRGAAGDTIGVYTAGNGSAWRAYVEDPPENHPRLERRWDVRAVTVHELAGCARDRTPALDCVVCADLTDAPPHDLSWILGELFDHARHVVHLAIRPDETPRELFSADAPTLHRTQDWWLDQLEHAARRRPHVHWQVVFHRASGSARLREGGSHLDEAPPSVWVLTDDRPGSNSQSVGLAEALGWPYVVKHLHFTWAALVHNRLLRASRLGVHTQRSSPLAAPWPDLVIAAGRRAAPVAQWIRERNLGRTRLVQLGRKGGDAADRFDLVVTPSYGRLDPHPHRIVTSAPLHGVTAAKRSEASAQWRSRLADRRSPRIVVLVGGRSGQYYLDRNTARRLGEDASRLAREAGGSVLVTTSRRTGAAATRALCAALDPNAYVHTWSRTESSNPYLAFLDIADAFVITGDSESMLAEAASSGRPIHIYPLPVRLSFRAMRIFREWVYARAHAIPSDRATPRSLSHVCAVLIDRGWVRPARDLASLHDALIRDGVAQHFGVAPEPRAARPRADRSLVVERVRALMGYASPPRRDSTR